MTFSLTSLPQVIYTAFKWRLCWQYISILLRNRKMSLIKVCAFVLFRCHICLSVKVGFSPTPAPLAAKGTVGMRRAGTLIRSPIEGRQRDREKQSYGDLRASEVKSYFCNLVISDQSIGLWDVPGTPCVLDISRRWFPNRLSANQWHGSYICWLHGFGQLFSQTSRSFCFLEPGNYETCPWGFGPDLWIPSCRTEILARRSTCAGQDVSPSHLF